MPNITINPDSQLVILHTRIRGVETQSEVVRDNKEGRTHTTERNVTRTVFDTKEYKEAKRLESLARAALKSAALHTPIGNISDSGRVARLRRRFEKIEAQVALFNKAAKHHSFYASLLVLPIASALGPEACRVLCEEVTSALDSVVALLQSGDVEGVKSWRARNRNLDSLMPEVIAGALRMSMGVIADSQRALNKCLKAGMEPKAAGATLDLTQIEVSKSLILPALPQPETEAA